MDSFKFFKGYGRVHNHNHLEDQSPQPKSSSTRKPLVATISLFVILFLTLIIGATLGALIHASNSEPPKPQSIPSTAVAAAAIRTVCNVTRFPASCFSSISSLNNLPQNPNDPEAILKLSLQISHRELSNFSSSLRTLASTSNGPDLADCKDQIDDALSRLNDSLSAMEAVPALTDAKIDNIKTWISSAMTEQETCVDGLKEMNSPAIGEVKGMMERSTEYISNSLAIVANIHSLLQRFNMPLH